MSYRARYMCSGVRHAGSGFCSVCSIILDGFGCVSILNLVHKHTADKGSEDRANSSLLSALQTACPVRI